MKKPVVIDHDEHWSINHALKRKAKEYSNQSGKNWSSYFSISDFPYSYLALLTRGKMPRSFNIKKAQHVEWLYHFSSTQCGCRSMRMGSKEEVICLATIIQEDGKKVFMLDSHRIGRCQHKYPEAWAKVEL